MDDHTTLVVLSDHGFELGALPDDPSKTRDMRRVSEKFHRVEGILYLYGNHVKQRRRIDQPTHPRRRADGARPRRARRRRATCRAAC